MKRLCVLLLTAPLLSGAAHAADSMTFGGSLHVATSEYRDTDAPYYPLPIFTYESDRFYVRGVTAGAYLFKNENHQLRAGLGWMPMYFDASKSDDRRMKRLDDRDTSLAAEAAYTFTSRAGVFNASVAGDILGKSDGVLISASYAYPVHVGATLLTPFASVTWASENFNDYYYGVSAKESARSGLAAYKAKSAVTPALGLNIEHPVSDVWTVYGTTSVSFLPSEVKDSSMVEEDVKWIVGAGVRYRFR